MRRYIETALRIKWRLIIAVILVFGLASGALIMAKQGIYSSTAHVWVDRPIYAPTDPGTNQYITPASVQAGIFQELLRTHQFTLEIAKRAGVAMPNVAAEDQIVYEIQKNLAVDAAGAHLINVKFTANKPTYCQAVVSAAIQLFREQTTSDAQAQLAQTLKVYEKDRDSAQQAMTASKDALSKYVQDHPDSTRTGSNDPTYSALQLQYSSDRERYDSVQSKIDDLNVRASSKVQLGDVLFKIVDDAQDPEPYRLAMKDLLRNSMIALMLAIFAAVGLTLVAAWTDPAVYTVADLSTLSVGEETAESSDLLVGVVPYIKTLTTGSKEIVTTEQGRQKSRRPWARGRGPRVTVVDKEPGSTRSAPASRTGGASDGVVRPVEVLPEGTAKY